jgi:hypothetical protein
MKHSYYKCQCNRVGCQFCDGGLVACTICDGAEGTLTKECCGRLLTKEEENNIYDRRLDYENGHWFIPVILEKRK